MDAVKNMEFLSKNFMILQKKNRITAYVELNKTIQIVCVFTLEKIPTEPLKIPAA